MLTGEIVRIGRLQTISVFDRNHLHADAVALADVIRLNWD